MGIDVKSANEEMEKIFQWANAMERERVESLKAEGKNVNCYDTLNKEFADIRAERDRRLYELADKYGIEYKR